MNTRAFTARIAERTNLFASTVEQVLIEALAELRQELVKTGRFEWRGLGTFTVRSYPARQIHNPSTGAIATLPARRSVAFKPSQKIRVLLTPPRPKRTKTKPTAKTPRQKRS